MQFAIRDHVNNLIGALANLVQGVTPISKLNNHRQLELNEPSVVDLPIVDLPIVDLQIVDHSFLDVPVPVISVEPELLNFLNAEMLLRPWLPSIEDIIAGCSLPTSALMDFTPGDDSSISCGGVMSHQRVRDFSELVSAITAEALDSTEDLAVIELTSLSESGVRENDFSHAVDDIFQPSQSIWQNN